MDLHNIAIRIATAQSISKDIIEAIKNEMQNKLGSDFTDYDVGERRKVLGHKRGYVSFGIRPSKWKNQPQKDGRTINGGLLIKGTGSHKSTAPEEGTDDYEQWVQSGGNPDITQQLITIDLEMSYYNKVNGLGGIDFDPLGTVDIQFDNMENITSIKFKDSGTAKSNLEDIIDHIWNHPPEGSLTAQPQMAPPPPPEPQQLPPTQAPEYENVEAFIEFRMDDEEETYTARDVNILHNTTGIPREQIVEELQGYGLRKAANLFSIARKLAN